jgi:hypothetical protein
MFRAAGCASPRNALHEYQAPLGGGLIEESDERPDPTLDDERRRYYRLTDDGRSAVAAEVERMESLVERARPWLRDGPMRSAARSRPNRALLRVYPRRFRADYQDEMARCSPSSSTIAA